MIIDHGSTNGLLVSPRGRYSVYKPKEWKILELGMVLRLGRVKVVPVNRNGDALLQVIRHSELLEHGEVMYGSQQETSRRLGVTYAWFRCWIRKIHSVPEVGYRAGPRWIAVDGRSQAISAGARAQHSGAVGEVRGSR